MDNELRHTDDISQLWGAQDNHGFEPAPLRRPVLPIEPARQHTRNGNGNVDRPDALERDVRALMQVVERVEALVNQRLSRLEQQVADLAASEERRLKGISRLSGVIKSTRNH